MTDHVHEAGKALHLLDRKEIAYIYTFPFARLATGLLVSNA